MKKPIKKKSANFSKSFKSLSLARKVLLFVFIAIVASSFLPAIIVLLIGLLPTLTVMFVSPKDSAKLIIIGCFNVAGLFIYLVNVLNKMTFDENIFLFGDVLNMLIMLGSAALGFVLYYEMPNLFAFITKISSQKRLIYIAKQLKKISEDWGEEIIDQQINGISK